MISFFLRGGFVSRYSSKKFVFTKCTRKENTMRRKLLACCLSVVMVVSLLPFPVGAANTPSTETTESIPENVAEIIASYFVDDFRTTPDCAWTADTTVSDTVTMYDIDGSISAYSFELTTNGTDTGYVVVSAYPDVESVILEFSDKEKPVYEAFNFAQTDSVVYTGTLNYFQETETGNLLTVEGSLISKSEVPTPLAESRDVSNLPAQTRAVITDPFVWAERYYGGQFSAVEWKNAFQNHCKFCTTTDFDVVKGMHFYNHCGPTAITNLILIVGNYRNYSPVKYEAPSNIFFEVARYGISSGYFLNSDDSFGMTYKDTLNKYIDGAFDLFDISVSVSSMSVTYANVKSAINGYRPFYLSVTNNSIYGNHGMAGYAYTVLENQYDDRISFVKVADGWGGSDGRYLPIYTLSGDVMHAISVGTLG